jgi:hypothetical protein
MAETSDRDAFDELIDLLQKHDLDWLVTETIDDIALGRTQKRVLAKLPRGDSEYQEVIVVPADFKESRRRTEFLTSEPFSVREQLLRLIGAVQNTVVESAQMEAMILRTTQLSVTFVGVGEEVRPEADIDGSIVQTRTHEAEALRKVLTTVQDDPGEQK